MSNLSYMQDWEATFYFHITTPDIKSLFGPRFTFKKKQICTSSISIYSVFTLEQIQDDASVSRLVSC